jgi:hypothetical protein
MSPQFQMYLFDDRACLTSICSGLSNLKEGADVLFQRCHVSASLTFDNRELVDGERVTLNQIGPRIWRLSYLFSNSYLDLAGPHPCCGLRK